MSNPSERGTGGRAPKALAHAERGGVWGAPSPEHFCFSYIKMVSFYAFLVIFVSKTHRFEQQKGTLIKRVGVQTPPPPGYAPEYTVLFATVLTALKFSSAIFFMLLIICNDFLLQTCDGFSVINLTP